MKKIFFIFMFLIFVLPVNASVIGNVKKIDNSFDTSLKNVDQIKNTNQKIFNVSVDDIKNPENISHWKIRFYCQKDMMINFSSSKNDSCGKAVKINSLDNGTFSFVFENQSAQNKKFSIKIKSYDKNGKWLYSERENFQWR